jgi:hypothetical protein
MASILGNRSPRSRSRDPKLLDPEVLARWTDEALEAADSAVQSPRSVVHEAPQCAKHALS